MQTELSTENELREGLDQVSRQRGRLEWMIPVVCCIVLLAQVFLSLRHLSQECDESTHLYAGYRILKCGDFAFGPEHPPLLKVVAAASLLGLGVPVNCAPAVRGPEESLDWLYANDFERLLFRARLAAAVFPIGLLLLVWIAARQMFGLAPAVIATLLLTFEPNFLARGALVTNDVAISCTLFFAVYAFYLWTRKHSAPRLALAGVAAGMTLLAKHSGVVIVPLLCLLAVLDAFLNAGARDRRWRTALRNLLAVALICAIATGILWAGYGFRFAAQPSGGPLPVTFSGGDGASLLMAARQHHLLPEAYLEGLQRARMMARVQMTPMFLLGKLHWRTRWYFFPVNMIVRYTLATLAFIGVGFWGAKYFGRQRRRELLFLAVPAGVYFAGLLYSRMPSGIRHTLPLLPFLLVLVAAGAAELARRVRWVKFAVPCLIVLHAASSLHAYPNYLSYANEAWGGPANVYRVLPWIDEGAAYKQVKQYLDQHPDQPCWLATTFMMQARYYGVRCQQFGDYYAAPVPPHVRGLVILSSSFLSTYSQSPGGSLGPFARLKPIDRIGGSAMLVYEGDFDLSVAAGQGEALASMLAFRDGNFREALEHGRRAAEFTPESADAHYQYCRALMASNLYDAAATECTIARALIVDGDCERKPVVDAAATRSRARAITEAIMSQQNRDEVPRRPGTAQVETVAVPAPRPAASGPGGDAAWMKYCRALGADRQYDLAEEECRLVRMNPPKYCRDRLDQINLMLYALGER